MKTMHILSGNVSPAMLEKAIEAFQGSPAETLVGVELDGTLAEQKLLIHSSEDQSTIQLTSDKAFPFKLILDEDAKYSKEEQLAAAEQYRDRIADRIFYPENVPAEKKLLINDDLRRVDVVTGFDYKGKVLEVGCSDGVVSLKIAEKPTVEHVVGLDIAPSCIEGANALKAERFSPEVGAKVDFRLLAIEDMDYAPEYFDAVCAFETLEHIGHGQLAKTLDMLTAALKPDGSMYITVPNRFPNTKYEEGGRARWKWDNHYHFYSIANLRYILGKYFTDIEFYPHYDGEQPGDSIYVICIARNKKAS